VLEISASRSARTGIQSRASPPSGLHVCQLELAPRDSVQSTPARYWRRTCCTASLVAARVVQVHPPSIICSPFLHVRRLHVRSIARRIITSYLEVRQLSAASPGVAELDACGGVEEARESGRLKDTIGGRGDTAKSDESNM
jgi:hypothetical protein